MPKTNKYERHEAARNTRRIHMVLALLLESAMTTYENLLFSEWVKEHARDILGAATLAKHHVTKELDVNGSAYQREFNADSTKLIAIREKHFPPITKEGHISNLQAIGITLTYTQLIADTCTALLLTDPIWKYLNTALTEFLEAILQDPIMANTNIEEPATACGSEMFEYLFKDQAAAMAA